MVVSKAVRLGRRERAFLVAGALAAALFVMLTVQVTTRTGLAAVDAPLAEWGVATSVGGAWLAHLAAAGASNRLLLPLALVASAWMWRRGRPVDALLIVGLLVATQALVHGLKAVIAMPRPSVAWLGSFGHAYPSGHAANGALVGALLAWYGGASWPRLAPAVGAVWALLIGWGRMLAGVHYLTDVVGGLAIGAALVCTALPLASALTVSAESADRRVPVGRRLRVHEASVEDEPLVMVRRPPPPPPPSPA